MLNPKAADYALVQHLAYEQDKIERLLEDPSLLQTPIVRNGRQATVAIARMCGRRGNEIRRSPIWRLPYRAFAISF